MMKKSAIIVYRILVVCSILLALGTAGTSDAVGLSKKEILIRMLVSAAVFVIAVLIREGGYAAERIRVQRREEQNRYLQIKEITEKMQREREEMEDILSSLRKTK